MLHAEVKDRELSFAQKMSLQTLQRWSDLQCTRTDCKEMVCNVMRVTPFRRIVHNYSLYKVNQTTCLDPAPFSRNNFFFLIL